MAPIIFRLVVLTLLFCSSSALFLLSSPLSPLSPLSSLLIPFARPLTLSKHFFSHSHVLVFHQRSKLATADALLSMEAAGIAVDETNAEQRLALVGPSNFELVGVGPRRSLFPFLFLIFPSLSSFADLLFLVCLRCFFAVVFFCCFICFFRHIFRSFDFVCLLFASLADSRQQNQHAGEAPINGASLDFVYGHRTYDTRSCVVYTAKVRVVPRIASVYFSFHGAIVALLRLFSVEFVLLFSFFFYLFSNFLKLARCFWFVYDVSFFFFFLNALISVFFLALVRAALGRAFNTISRRERSPSLSARLASSTTPKRTRSASSLDTPAMCFASRFTRR